MKRTYEMPLNWTPVSSSNISGMFYQPVQKILSLKFKNGRKYRYYDIDFSTFTDFVNAKSPGSYFHSNIKSHKYEQFYEKGDEDNEQKD